MKFKFEEIDVELSLKELISYIGLAVVISALPFIVKGILLLFI